MSQPQCGACSPRLASRTVEESSGLADLQCLDVSAGISHKGAAQPPMTRCRTTGKQHDFKSSRPASSTKHLTSSSPRSHSETNSNHGRTPRPEASVHNRQCQGIPHSRWRRAGLDSFWPANPVSAHGAHLVALLRPVLDHPPERNPRE